MLAMCYIFIVRCTKQWKKDGEQWKMESKEVGRVEKKSNSDFEEDQKNFASMSSGKILVGKNVKIPLKQKVELKFRRTTLKT